MHPDLQRALDDITRSVTGMTGEQMEARLPGKWSASDILEHLMLSFQASGARLVSAMDEGQPMARPGTWKERLGAFVVVSLGYFPTGRKAPEYVQPKGMKAPDIVDAAKAALVDFDATAARCAGRFGPGRKVTNHPILGPFSVRQWRRFHRVHTRHHMKQVAALRTSGR